MGWGKRILGIGEIAAGAITGQPALAIKGGADVAGSFAGGGKPAGVTATGGGARGIDLASPPPYPTVAHSLKQDKSQRRFRMKDVYGFRS